MNGTSLPTPAPTVYPETQEFWRGTASGRLVLQRCNTCNAVIWYPRRFCPECGSTSLTSFEASGRGRIYSCTVCRRGADEYRGIEAYVVAYVELDEGPRVLTNIVDCALEDVHIGESVEAVFHTTGEDSALVRFRPRSA